jgi:hypothetical protein
VASHGLQCVALLAAGIAIVDDDRDAAIGGKMLCQLLSLILACRRSLADRTIEGEGETFAVLGDPALLFPDPLLDRQRIEELVGYKQQRRLRQAGKIVVKNSFGKQLRLGLTERRACFDQVNFAFESGAA